MQTIQFTIVSSKSFQCKSSLKKPKQTQNQCYYQCCFAFCPDFCLWQPCHSALNFHSLQSGKQHELKRFNQSWALGVVFSNIFFFSFPCPFPDSQNGIPNFFKLSASTEAIILKNSCLLSPIPVSLKFTAQVFLIPCCEP